MAAPFAIGTAAALAGVLLVGSVALRPPLAPAVRPSLGPRLVEVGAAPRPPVTAHRLATVAGRAQVSFDLVLAPQHRVQLASLLASVTTPGSPQYRHYLRRGEFRARFAPSHRQLRSIESALRHLGLTPSALSANGMELTVHARASAVERALRTPLVSYRLASGSVVTENVLAPRLPASLAAHVSALLGLEGTSSLRPSGLERFIRPSLSPSTVAHDGAGPAPSAACSQATGGPSSAGFTADQIASAYGLSALYGAGDLGDGVTIAIVAFAPFLASDIATYAQCYGAPVQPSIETVSVDGGPQSADPESEVEAELDIEDVVGLVPHAQVIVYEGPNSNGGVSNQAAFDTYSRIVADDRAQVVSTSWGGCEKATGTSAVAAENVLFEQAALQGQTVVAASGDSGSEDCYQSHRSSTYGLAVDDPASQPFVTGVGGTTLTLSPTTETVWNTGLSPFTTAGAGGGGLSSFWPVPGYQLNAAASLDVIGPDSHQNPCKSANGDCREVPDVAANAGSPYAIYCTMGDLACSGSGWTALGGTTAAAPTWAALIALTDASNACHGVPIGFANPALYAVAGQSAAASAVTDITSGTNDLTGTNGGDYPARAGYDLASGLGSPRSGSGTDNGLTAQLCGANARATSAAGLPRPSVKKVTPGTARSTGGAHIVVTGSTFLDVTGVRFGASAARSFTVTSATKLVATAPPGSGNVHVTVINRVGASERTRADVFAYLLVPSLARLAPTDGPARGGTAVVLIGSGLSGARAVHFGKRAALSFRVVSSKRIIALSPPGTGAVRVEVTTRNGTSADLAKSRFLYSG